MAKAFGIVTSTPRRVNVYGLQDCRPADGSRGASLRHDAGAERREFRL